MDKIVLQRSKWYNITHKDSLGVERTHCARVITNYGSGYLFWARQSPEDKKDEFCFGARKENIIKIESYRNLKDINQPNSALRK